MVAVRLEHAEGALVWGELDQFSLVIRRGDLFLIS
jgi:hypothetical protein